MNNKLDTYNKALAFNMDRDIYGTIAEIGAGQETVRWFFKVGGAAGSIAKSISAYDMTFSDSIYGDCNRYVSRERLHAMLDKEYELLNERLSATRGDDCAFFAYANTVATFSYMQQTSGHGWMGIQFQAKPGDAVSEIILHTSLKGKSSTEDQKTLGILGVNLIYAARNLHQEPLPLLLSLMDELSADKLEIDHIDFAGPAFATVDNRVMALRLVEHGLTHSAMFQADGKLVLPSDALYKKAVLVERSRFRPPTRLNMDMLDCAYKAFKNETRLADDDIVVVSEMTLQNLKDGDEINVEDFLQRVDILCALGKNVMISNYVEFYRLAQYLYKLTRLPVAVTLGTPTLKQVFDETYYGNLDGGILEAFGKLFRNDMRMYVCPALKADGSIETINNLQVAKHLDHLYQHLLTNGFMKHLDDIEYDNLSIHADVVLDMIRQHEANWAEMVPQRVAEIINERGLFGV